MEKPSGRTSSPPKDGPKIQEFPSQIRRLPEKQPSGKPIEKAPSQVKQKLTERGLKLQEFPSQVRRSPEKQPLEKPSRKVSPAKEGPKIREFPAQVRRVPEKRALEKPATKDSPFKEGPKIQEYPAQIRKVAEKPLVSAKESLKAQVRKEDQCSEKLLKATATFKEIPTKQEVSASVKDLQENWSITEVGEQRRLSLETDLQRP